MQVGRLHGICAVPEEGEAPGKVVSRSGRWYGKRKGGMAFAVFLNKERPQGRGVSKGVGDMLKGMYYRVFPTN